MRYKTDLLLPEELLAAERRSRDCELVERVREEIESGLRPHFSWLHFPVDPTGKPILEDVWEIQ